jgi:hypothetical protein
MQKLLNKVIFCTLILLVYSSVKADGDDLVELYSWEKPINKDISEKSAFLDKFGYLLEANPNDVEHQVNDIFLNVFNKRAIKVKPEAVSLATFLNFAMPFFCAAVIEDKNTPPETNRFFSELLGTLSKHDKAYGEIIKNQYEEKKAYSSKVLLYLSLFKVACESKGVTDTTENLEKDKSWEEVLKELGVPMAEVDKYRKEYAEKGFAQVPDDQIYDIESHYEQFKGFLKSYEDVRNTLTFNPSPIIEDASFEFLGAEAVGAQSSSGSTAIVSLYETKLGKMSIEELDTETSHSITYTAEDAYNLQVGEQKAMITIQKGESSGVFLSNISWENPETLREYTVEINLNLNDPANDKDRKYLLEVLAKNYDK